MATYSHMSVPLYICMSSHTLVCSLYVMGTLGGNLYAPICHGDFWGAYVHLYICQTSLVSQDIHLSLSSYWSYQLHSIIVDHFSAGLDAYEYMVSFMLLTCSFLCSVFIMSQASATVAVTTTPPVTVVCSGTSSLLTTVTMAPSLMGLPVISGQHDMVLPPLLTLRNSGGVVGLDTVPQQQPQSQMPLQAHANYAMASLQVGFSFRVESPTFLYVLVSVLMYAFYIRCHPWCLNHLWDPTIGVCTIAALWSLPRAGICVS